MKKEDIWVYFAAGALQDPNVENTARAAMIADDMLSEYDMRFGDGKFFLDGQKECNACHQPVEQDFIISDDNLKFCNKECMWATGRTSVQHPNPGIEIEKVE